MYARAWLPHAASASGVDDVCARAEGRCHLQYFRIAPCTQREAERCPQSKLLSSVRHFAPRRCRLSVGTQR